jgi:hypothetical protein
VYAWIWRHLPFGLAGKIVGSVLLVAAVGALLWFQVFPAVEPLLPFVDGQVTDTTGVPPDGRTGGPAPAGTDVPTPPPDVIPYPEDSNNVSPRPGR